MHQLFGACQALLPQVVFEFADLPQAAWAELRVAVWRPWQQATETVEPGQKHICIAHRFERLAQFLSLFPPTPERARRVGIRRVLWQPMLQHDPQPQGEAAQGMDALAAGLTGALGKQFAPGLNLPRPPRLGRRIGLSAGRKRIVRHRNEPLPSILRLLARLMKANPLLMARSCTLPEVKKLRTVGERGDRDHVRGSSGGPRIWVCRRSRA